MKKLFIGNLPYQASESELQDWFTRSGVSADGVSIVRDRFSGEPRGFGFAEIRNDEDAEKAIAACNGREFLGRTVVVNEARPMTDRPPASRSGGFGGGGGDRSRGGNSGGGGFGNRNSGRGGARRDR